MCLSRFLPRGPPDDLRLEGQDHRRGRGLAEGVQTTTTTTTTTTNDNGNNIVIINDNSNDNNVVAQCNNVNMCIDKKCNG